MARSPGSLSAVGHQVKRLGWILFVVAAFLLHQDTWWWNDPRLVWPGLPIGLAYHVAYCLVLAAVFVWVVLRHLPQEELPTEELRAEERAA